MHDDKVVSIKKTPRISIYGEPFMRKTIKFFNIVNPEYPLHLSKSRFAQSSTMHICI